MPNSTDSRPRLSPSTPQTMPPISMPPICMLSSITPVEQICPVGDADGAQARHADDAEQDQVVDVDEVAERGHEDGQRHGAAVDRRTGHVRRL